MHNTGEYSLCLEAKQGLQRGFAPLRFKIAIKDVHFLVMFLQKPKAEIPKNAQEPKQDHTKENENSTNLLKLWSRLNTIRSKITRMGTDDAMVWPSVITK